MKYVIFAGVVSLGLLVTGAQAQEESHNDVTVSATGIFQKSTTGNGITQTASQEPGLLATYRYFFTDHQGLEFNYGFTQFNQQYTGANSSSPLSLAGLGLTGTSLSVPTDTHEATVSYVYRLAARHRLSPFVSAGTGVWVFSPQASASFGTATGNTFVTPDFAYSGGADFAFSRKISFRLGYRGHVLQAPGFGIGAIKTGSVTYLSEPFGGLSFRF
ncbi:MAG TPA: outer membrane beta-barrel protein [Bryobacteraceae bacterium]